GSRRDRRSLARRVGPAIENREDAAMPIYEYQCADCGRRLERLQRRDDPPPEDCECGGTMQRLVSAPAFQFKGSGWYVTDYAGRKPAGDGDSGDAKPAAERDDRAAEKKDGEKKDGEKKDGEKKGGEKAAGERPAGGKASAEGSKAGGKAVAAGSGAAPKEG
ncbi:MAG: hypothetical protein OEP45_15790, partial [Acidobacteriota bacterium]|nr:hypothetical protein [Acidobacteriota bacterium]